MNATRIHRLVPFIGYPLVVLMLGLAWLNPQLIPQAEPIDLMVVMDESESVDQAFLDHGWQQLRRLQSLFPEEGRFSLIRFADRPRQEIPWTAWTDDELQRLLQQPSPPRKLALNPHTTAVTDALELAIDELDHKRTSVILLLSDGRDNTSGNAPRLPKSAGGLAIYWSRPRDNQRNGALLITSLNAPTRVRPDLTFPLSAAITSTNTGESILSLKLDGRRLTEQTIKLSPQDYNVQRFQLSSETIGTHRLELQLSDTNGKLIDSRIHYFETVEDQQLLYLSHRTIPSLPLASLEQNGWHVTHLGPKQLLNPARFSDASLVLLEDIGIHELASPMWSALTESVEQQGTGLIVLGGPNSFGSGGYRHSLLEQLLPVVAESAQPEPAAAFLFLLDKSGSMDDSANRLQSRLATALRAISESARSLQSGDSVGLSAFDLHIQTLLPLQTHADPHSLLSQPWRLSPSGGTKLEPALRSAINQLAESKMEKRILILITDGFVENELPSLLVEDLKRSHITLIALAIGEDADLSILEPLAAITNGRVLRVKRTAELPQFMRHELEQQRQSWQTEETQPQTIRDLPFIESTPTAWKTLRGYQITRAKPDTVSYLTTGKGDPLLAVTQSGAGRVAVLPGGLLYPSGSAEIMLPLLAWTDNRLENPRLQLSYQSHADKLQIRLDALDSDGYWSQSLSADLKLWTPAGFQQHHRLPLLTPGRYEKHVTAPVSGLYVAQISVNDEQVRQLVHHVKDLESTNTPPATWLHKGLNEGIIHNWSEESLMQFVEAATRYKAFRNLWLFFALLIFLSIILHERRAGVAKTITLTRGGTEIE